MPGQAGYSGGFGTLAADIADREPPATPGNLEHVVEVAANLIPLARCLVRCRQVHAGDARQLGRQQAALQRAGGLPLLRVEPGVVQGKRRTPGQILRQIQGISRHCPAARPADHEDSGAAVAGAQRKAPGRIGDQFGGHGCARLLRCPGK